MSKARTLANTVSTGGSLETPDAIPASDISGLSTVATSGSYNDLSNKPTTIATADDLSGGVTGAIPYQANVGDTAMLSPGTSGQVLTSGGSGAAPSWAALPSGSEVIRVARTSNTALATSNRGNLIDITSGTFTQTFDAAATLGNGWFCYIRNSGTGDITLDPNGSETIDGLTSYVMYQYETRLVQCTGTAFITIVLSPFYRVFTTTGTFTKPPGYIAFGGQLWGGGGGGGRSNQSTGGGGGGAYLPIIKLASDLSASETVTIGAGGSGGTTSPSTGGTGGTTSAFGYSAPGGVGSQGVSGLDADGANGASVSPYTVSTAINGYAGEGGKKGKLNNTTASDAAGNSEFGGGGGGGSGAGTTAYLVNGGSSLYGGGGGGGGKRADTVFGIGGTSLFGGAGGNGGTDSTNGSNGATPGGGGGGAGINRNGGNGGSGLVRIWGIV